MNSSSRRSRRSSAARSVSSLLPRQIGLDAVAEHLRAQMRLQLVDARFAYVSLGHQLGIDELDKRIARAPGAAGARVHALDEAADPRPHFRVLRDPYHTFRVGPEGTGTNASTAAMPPRPTIVVATARTRWRSSSALPATKPSAFAAGATSMLTIDHRPITTPMKKYSHHEKRDRHHDEQAVYPRDGRIEGEPHAFAARVRGRSASAPRTRSASRGSPSSGSSAARDWGSRSDRSGCNTRRNAEADCR